MKHLEDRIKDRLEGYESSLPEGDLAEFEAMLDASATAGKNRATWFAPVAVAAVLALSFVFGHGPQQGIVQTVDGGSLMADASLEVADPAEMELDEEAVSVWTDPSVAGIINRPDVTLAVNEMAKSIGSEPDVSEQRVSEQVGSIRQADKTERTEGGETRREGGPSMGGGAGDSPFVPSGIIGRKPVSMKVGRAAAGVLGGTGMLALANVLTSNVIPDGKDNASLPDSPVNPGGTQVAPEPIPEGRTMNDTHYSPFRAGLSLRIPFTDRWSLTTGLDYSRYVSMLGHSLSGIHKQCAHYLGIPLRADFTIARNRRLDVYAGAGASVDFCLAAFDAGQKIAGDGVGLSLVGAGGIQFNISREIGLFLDPTLSWSTPLGQRKLDTYKSEQAIIVTVPIGLRFTMP